MNVTIRFFSHLKDTVGVGQIVLDMPDGADLQAVVQRLIADYPMLDGQQVMWHFAVNQTHAEPDQALRAGDRVTIFPYLAGG